MGKSIKYIVMEELKHIIWKAIGAVILLVFLVDLFLGGGFIASIIALTLVILGYVRVIIMLIEWIRKKVKTS